MGTIQMVSLAKMTIVGLVLIGSSIMDVKYRRIPDRFWVLMLLGAGPLTVWEMFLRGGDESPITFLALLLPLAGMLFILYGYPEIGEIKKGNPQDILFLLVYLGAIIGTIIAFIFGNRELFMEVGVSFIFMLIYFVLYTVPIGGTRIIHGGADAKCLIALAGLFPWYVLDLPMQTGPFYGILDNISAMGRIFPISLSVLFNAAVITALIMFIYLPIRNLRKGEFSLSSFTTFHLDVDELEGSHVWVFVEGKDGKEKKDPTHRVITGLRKKGIERVKVSPKIPFILSLTAGFLLQLVLGNVVAALFLAFN
jgi:preflagellin peptidase FlaK